jgi:hypothetical protein
MLKHYDLDVRFLTAEGEQREVEAEFFRFFTGPDEGDTMTVRYLKSDPGVAVSSWEHEGTTHGWGLLGFTVFIALLWAIRRGYRVLAVQLPEGAERRLERISAADSQLVRESRAGEILRRFISFTAVLLGIFLTVLFRADAKRKRHFAESTAT